MKLDLEAIKRMLEEQATRLPLDVPPIPFEIDETSSDVNSDTDDKKTSTRTFTLKLNPEKKHSNTIEKHVSVFYDCSPKDWVKFRQDLDDLEQELPLETYEQKYKTVCHFRCSTSTGVCSPMSILLMHS